jgi:hypothetical protein
MPRRTDELEARISEPSGVRRATARAGQRRTAFWAVMRTSSGETRKHMKAAGREQLMAARSYLDHWIKKMDAAHEEEKAAPRESIEVE